MAMDDALRRMPDLGYHEEPPALDAEEFFKVIESRRSIRSFEKTPIPETVMRRCLGAALLAPSSSNMQPWELHWVRSPEKKSKLVQACLSQPAAATAAELVVFVARTRRWPEMRERMLAKFDAQGNVPAAARKYYEKLIPLMLNQGPLGLMGLAKRVLMFFRGLSTPTPREPCGEMDMRVWATKSTALACENYMLALRACGFDSCPMEGFDPVLIRKLLGLPTDAYVAMVISAGKRAKGGVYGPQVRFAPELFIVEH